MIEISESGDKIGEKLLMLLNVQQRQALIKYLLSQEKKDTDSADSPCDSFQIHDPQAEVGGVFTEIEMGELYFCLEQRLVRVRGQVIELTAKEFDILAFFLQNQDIALTRERLLATVWGYEFMGETRTVDIHVQQIRKKMGLHNKLVTIPKLGYRLERNN